LDCHHKSICKLLPRARIVSSKCPPCHRPIHHTTYKHAETLAHTCMYPNIQLHLTKFLSQYRIYPVPVVILCRGGSACFWFRVSSLFNPIFINCILSQVL
jgi:hypothetical protein